IGISDDTGAYRDTYSYRPFGDTLISYTSSSNAFTFGGQFGVVSDSTGLKYMRARSFTTATGRFTTIDPIRTNSGDLNFYRYTANDPIMFVDPTGLISRINAFPFYDSGLINTGRGEGCGSGDSQWVPDRYLFQDLRNACENHDACYSTCGMTKAECDANLG